MSEHGTWAATSDDTLAWYLLELAYGKRHRLSAEDRKALLFEAALRIRDKVGQRDLSETS